MPSGFSNRPELLKGAFVEYGLSELFIFKELNYG